MGHVNKNAERRMIVNMTVSDDTDFLSVYSEKLTPVICSEIAEFIEHCTIAIPHKSNLTLRIHSNCIDDREKPIYREAIFEYYERQYEANEIERKHNNVISLLLFLAGVLVLVFMTFLPDHSGWQVCQEVIDIIAWVLLWEAVDISVFRSKVLRVKRDRCKTYMSMVIEYVSLEEKGE